MNKPKISVIGLGFVGLSLAVVNAEKGFKTIGIDADKKKLELLEKSKPPFYEPRIKNALKKTVKSKNLSFTDDLNRILETSITFLTVGTPSTHSGNIDLSQLKRVVTKLSKILQKKKSDHLIAIKSTVTPTTTEKIILPKFHKLKKVGVVVNPEFLREGNAIRDLLKPHLIVIGESSKKDGDTLQKYYKIFYNDHPEIVRTSLTTAEMIKYANNAFLATKISFINSIANICQKIPNVDVNKIAYAIGKDSRIGSQFLNAGPGFGGSCLPKDLSAFIEFSNKFGKINSLFKAVKQVNDSQHLQIINLLKKMNLLQKGKTISILGLAFKKNTDDIREAISIKFVKKLLKNGLKIKVHDPLAIDNFRRVFLDDITYCKTSKDCMKNADVCIFLTEWDEYKKIKQSNLKRLMKKPNVIDARRILDPKNFKDVNFKAIGLGEK